MGLHNQFRFPLRQFLFLLRREFIFHITEDLVRLGNIHFHIAVWIARHFLLHKSDRFFFRRAAAVTDPVEDIGPVQIIFLIDFQFIADKIPVAQFG